MEKYVLDETKEDGLKLSPLINIQTNESTKQKVTKEKVHRNEVKHLKVYDKSILKPPGIQISKIKWTKF